MVRHYVGARYVPKFADPVAWTSGTSYEAMTIVTYNNSSYTSKIPVPATVGNPADNPDYWALTGNYNAQVEQYRQETETVSNNLTTEITNRNNADTTLQGQITTLQSNFNSEVATRASADSNLQSQINQIIAPSGEAPSAAEVQNARIGADGVTYDTLGTAIRTQVNNLHNDIKNIKKVNIFDKTDITRGGYFRGTIGADINSVINKDGAFYANQIWDVKEGDIIRNSNPYMGLTIYDTTGKLIAKFNDENLSHVVPSGGVKLRYSSTVTSANYLDNAIITINFEMPETYVPYGLDSFPTYEDSLIVKNFNDIENKNKKTYVILRFDATGNEDFIEDRRYAMVREEYGYNCTIPIGYASSGLATTSEQFQKLMKYGVDFGIYSNNNPPSLDILSSNSQEAISICDTYVKNATEAAKAIGAYCPVTWLCRQSNSGYALELALKKYGYMLASGIYYGDTNTGLIEDSNKFTLQTTGLYPNTISTAISKLDTAVEKGYDIAILTHKFYDTAEEAQENYGCTEDVYRQFLSAVKSYVDAGKVEVLTYSEYISKRKDNAVLRSKENQRIANWIFN